MRVALLLALFACHRESMERPPEPSKPSAAAGPSVELPVLPDDRGTLPADRGMTVTITATRVSIEDVGDFDPAKPDEIRERMRSVHVDGPTLLAIDRAVTMRTLGVLYDRVLHSELGELELVVTAAKQTRVVIIDNEHVSPSVENPTYGVVTLGATLFFNGEAVTLDELRARVAKSPPDRVFVMPEPDVTVQRIAEAIAAAGGHATLGGARLQPKRPLSPPTPPAVSTPPAKAPPAKAPSPVTSTPSYAPPEPWTRCEQDDECTVTGAQCGNHSFAINRQHAAEAQAEVARLCKGHDNVLTISAMPQPRCKDRRCVDAYKAGSGLELH